MAEIQKGIAVRWGVAGISFTGITLTTDASKIQSLEFNRTSDKKDVPDSSGETAGQIFYNHKKSITLSVIPASTTGATITAANANILAWLPSPGTTLTAADTAGAFIDASSAAEYNVLSAKARMSNDNVVMCDLEIERFDANSVTGTANS